MGKSRLLVEATRDRPTIYYQATKIAGSMSLNLFKAEVERVVGSDPILGSLGDWLGVMAYLEQVATTRMPGLTVVLDEFPYLCEADAALPSIFQKCCDGLRDRGSPLNLILCGSKISFMEGLLGEKNPMHGRQTFELDLKPLPFRDAARFFPDWTPEERLCAYGIFGGIPYYLNFCDPGTTLETNVCALVLSTGAPLADEPNNLLQAELRDVTRYATILRAVADGCTVSGDIIARVREIRDSSALAPYIRKLEELRLIRIVRSLDASERERNRRYYLDDYMGGIFEWICRDYARLFAREVLPTAAREVGQIWAKDYDIDVAGRLLDEASFSGECKWWSGGRAARRGRFACTTLEAYVMWPLAEEGASPSGSLRIARRALGVSLGSAPPLASLTRNALGQKNLEQALVGNISLVCEGLELLQECLR